MHCSHCTSSPITVDPEDFQPQEIGILKVSTTFANITEPVNVVHMYEDNMFSIKVIYIMLTLNLATTRDWHPQKFQQHFQTKLNQSIYCYCYWNVNTDDHIRFRECEKIWSIWYCFQSVKKNLNPLHHDCMCLKLATDHWLGPTFFLTTMHSHLISGRLEGKEVREKAFWPILANFDLTLKVSKLWAPQFVPLGWGETTKYNRFLCLF